VKKGFAYTGSADQLDALGAKLCADSVSDQDQAAAEPRATIQSRQGDAQIEQRGRARADSLHEVAHELTHVVQQCTPQNGAQAVDGQAGVLQCPQRLNKGSHNTTRSNIRG
jgi:hypothetical protein